MHVSTKDHEIRNGTWQKDVFHHKSVAYQKKNALTWMNIEPS